MCIRDRFVTALDNVGIGTRSPTNKLELLGTGNIVQDVNNTSNGGAFYYKSASQFGSARNNTLISQLGSSAGRIINRNPDFLDGTTGYLAYDNASSGLVT